MIATPAWLPANMGLLPDMKYCRLCMRRECRESFPRCRLQSKSLVSNPRMHHGTLVSHVPWCMSGSLTSDGGENVPGIPGACATRDISYLVRSPCLDSLHKALSLWRYKQPRTKKPTSCGLDSSLFNGCKAVCLLCIFGESRVSIVVVDGLVLI